MRIFLGKLCDLDGGAACTNDDDGDEDNGVGRRTHARPSGLGTRERRRRRTPKCVRKRRRRAGVRAGRPPSSVSDDAASPMQARRPADRRHLAPRARDETERKNERGGSPSDAQARQARDPMRREGGKGRGRTPTPVLTRSHGASPSVPSSLPLSPGVVSVVRSLIERAKVQGGNCAPCSLCRCRRYD